MLLYLLSSRQVTQLPSNGVAVELEELLVRSCGARLMTAEQVPGQNALRLAAGTPPLEGAPADRVLLVVALWTNLLGVLLALPDWRRQFGLVAGYVFDPWVSWEQWPGLAPRELDLFFVPDVRVAERYRSAHRVSATALAMGADVLRYGSGQGGRPLSVTAYGRQHPAYLQALEAAFNAPQSRRFLYLDTIAGAPMLTTRFTENRRLVWKLLHRSACSLCFDPMVAPGNQGHVHPLLPLRYYEAAAAGAAIIGIHPQVPELEDGFSWPDATISLPATPAAAVPFVEALLDDTARLNAIHQRNFTEAWRRHDWRYRLRDLFQHLGLPLPPRLQQELALLAGPPGMGLLNDA
jgi:hypothetical protein